MARPLNHQLFDLGVLILKADDVSKQVSETVVPYKGREQRPDCIIPAAGAEIWKGERVLLALKLRGQLRFPDSGLLIYGGRG